MNDIKDREEIKLCYYSDGFTPSMNYSCDHFNEKTKTCNLYGRKLETHISGLVPVGYEKCQPCVEKSSGTISGIRRQAIDSLQLELSWMDEYNREIALQGLSIIPEKFFYIPASSTGKYHPDYANGVGGLLRHTKAALLYAHELMTIQSIEIQQIQDDIYLALLFHDCGKPEWEHPLMARAILMPLVMKYPTKMDEVLRLISTHMGQWSTSDKHPGIELPTPQDEAQRFVHLCDYLASRKALEINIR